MCIALRIRGGFSSLRKRYFVLKNEEKHHRSKGPFTLVLAVTMEGDSETAKEVDAVFEIPATLHQLSPVLSVIPLQLLSYHAAVLRDCDVDKPRNLAKSVTVE
jgi:glucosamine 6-phosphate synthetase-like amidotransferase/phosphosugar isomerase protein